MLPALSRWFTCVGRSGVLVIETGQRQGCRVFLRCGVFVILRRRGVRQTDRRRGRVVAVRRSFVFFCAGGRRAGFSGGRGGQVVDGGRGFRQRLARVIERFPQAVRSGLHG